MLRTDSQQKKLCKTCPIAKAAHLVGDSIMLIIIRELLSGPKRFGDLSVSLAGVSTRTITQKLKKLEEENVIVRKEFIEKPPHVEYSLTKKGRGLKKIIDALFKYGKDYL